MTILYILIGFLLATLGVTILNSVSDLISAMTEWAKAAISVRIVKCNVTINELNEKTEKRPAHAIGFVANTYEEEEDNE